METVSVEIMEEMATGRKLEFILSSIECCRIYILNISVPIAEFRREELGGSNHNIASVSILLSLTLTLRK
jgi:hypothetical protein